MRAGWWLVVLGLVWTSVASAAETEFLVGRGFDVGLWGTGLNTFPDPRNPKEYAFDSIIRSPTTQGMGRIYVKRRGLAGLPVTLAIDFNTYKFSAYLTHERLAGTNLYAGIWTRSEWFLTGLFVHHMKQGDNVRELGFIAYFAQAGGKLGYSVGPHLDVELDVSARSWLFHRGLRTDPRFRMPPSMQTLEPRVRMRFKRIVFDRSLGLPHGVAAVGEVGVDFRRGSTPWGGLEGEPFDGRNLVGPGKVPRRVQGRMLVGQPLMRDRFWLTFQAEAGFGLDEDDISRARLGGLNPFGINLPGAAWGEYWAERYAVGHAEWGVRAHRLLYTGVAVHAAAFNDPLRTGDLWRVGAIAGVTSETRIGLGPLGYVKFRVGGSPHVLRKKTLGSLNFLFFWEVGNSNDRF